MSGASPASTESADDAIRPATAADADGIADVYLAAFHSTYAFPLAHTDDQVRIWLAGIVAGEPRTWVAEADGRVVAMIVLDDDGIDQLYRNVGSVDNHSAGIQQRPPGIGAGF